MSWGAGATEGMANVFLYVADQPTLKMRHADKIY